jgi:uncharacterized protein YceH (UPF0502 family)
MNQQVSRPLDRNEVRVLGALLEKEQATPEYYPLTMKALVAACNQRSNRYPVLNLSEGEVLAILERLESDALVAEDDRGRASRWSHKLHWKWNLNGPRKAAMTVLLLRGPQTVGEIRSRTGRMHEFASTDAVEDALTDLAAPPDPLVVLLEREPGQKEPRWAHRVGSEDPVSGTRTPVTAAARATPSGGAVAARPAQRQFDAELMMRRIERLEQQVLELQAAVFKKGGLPG